MIPSGSSAPAARWRLRSIRPTVRPCRLVGRQSAGRLHAAPPAVDECGKTWSAADLRTIVNATNPALAVNSVGKVAFLYQQLTGSGSAQRWQTHVERSTDGFNWGDTLLASVPANNPPKQFDPYIGDYCHILAGQGFLWNLFGEQPAGSGELSKRCGVPTQPRLRDEDIVRRRRPYPGSCVHRSVLFQTDRMNEWRPP